MHPAPVRGRGLKIGGTLEQFIKTKARFEGVVEGSKGMPAYCRVVK